MMTSANAACSRAFGESSIVRAYGVPLHDPMDDSGTVIPA